MDSFPTIVFVCEHGAAKSIVAAALFNHLAADRQLSLRAIARGTLPDDEIASAAAEGMRRDGLTGLESKPQKLGIDDFDHAVRVITFCPLPSNCFSRAPLEDWSDIPPVSGGYEQSREALNARIGRLLDELEKSEKWTDAKMT